MARDKSGFRSFEELSGEPAIGDTSPPDLTSGGGPQQAGETSQAVPIEDTQIQSGEAQSESTAPVETPLSAPLFHVTVSGEGGPYYLAGRTLAARAQLTTDREKALTFTEEEAGKHAEGLRQPQDWVVEVVPAN